MYLNKIKYKVFGKYIFYGKCVWLTQTFISIYFVHPTKLLPRITFFKHSPIHLHTTSFSIKKHNPCWRTPNQKGNKFNASNTRTTFDFQKYIVIGRFCFRMLFLTFRFWNSNVPSVATMGTYMRAHFECFLQMECSIATPKFVLRRSN